MPSPWGPPLGVETLSGWRVSLSRLLGFAARGQLSLAFSHSLRSRRRRRGWCF